MTIEQHGLALDTRGYLQKPEQWNPEVATWLASQEHLSLSEEHWDIIRLLRSFYAKYQLVPNNRALVRVVREAMGADKGSSSHLMSLFDPANPAAQATKIAGLPSGNNCIEERPQ